jgi:citrate lyase subunit beta / citryl-CoA lyase
MTGDASGDGSPEPVVSRASLFVPAHVTRFVESAWRRGADVIILDLEDSVAPSAKAEARAAVRAAIPLILRGGSAISVRINHDTWAEDIEAALWPGVSVISFPKAESAEEIRRVAALLDRLEPERGIAPGATRIAPAIETVAGLYHAREIATASARVTGVGGPAPVDFATDLGLELDPTLDQLEGARGELDLLSRATGGRGTGRWSSGQAITEYGEAGRFLAAAVRARRNGGRGSTGIHPSLVEPFRLGYTPAAEEEEEAREIVAAFERAWSEGRGWAAVRGRIVSRRTAEAARRYVAFAEACRAQDARRQTLVEQAERGDTA